MKDGASQICAQCNLGSAPDDGRRPPGESLPAAPRRLPLVFDVAMPIAAAYGMSSVIVTMS